MEAFLRAAVDDPLVIGIKMTLYRIGANSPLVDLLLEAADAGKQVAVLVELKARFDERNNIQWAQRLEAAGIHVVYGVLNLKTHCKVCLLIRKEAEGIRRYAHLGTGNYNAGTARLYTDLGLFTSRNAIVEDASDLFNYLTGYSHQPPVPRTAGCARQHAHGTHAVDRTGDGGGGSGFFPRASSSRSMRSPTPKLCGCSTAHHRRVCRWT